jgi:hypothetical protein
MATMSPEQMQQMQQMINNAIRDMLAIPAVLEHFRGPQGPAGPPGYATAEAIRASQ